MGAVRIFPIFPVGIRTSTEQCCILSVRAMTLKSILVLALASDKLGRL